MEDGKTGYLVEVKSRDDLYEKMKEMIELSREERKAMGVAGREKMVREFDKQVVVAETIKALGV